MRNNSERGACVCVIGSMTQTMRAQSVLASAAIRAEVVGADSSKNGRGCAYALSYPCIWENDVKRILRDAGIRVRARYEERQ